MYHSGGGCFKLRRLWVCWGRRYMETPCFPLNSAVKLKLLLKNKIYNNMNFTSVSWKGDKKEIPSWNHAHIAPLFYVPWDFSRCGYGYPALLLVLSHSQFLPICFSSCLQFHTHKHACTTFPTPHTTAIVDLFSYEWSSLPALPFSSCPYSHHSTRCRLPYQGLHGTLYTLSSSWKYC